MIEENLLIAGEKPRLHQRLWAWIVFVFSKKSDESELNNSKEEAF